MRTALLCLIATPLAAQNPPTARVEQGTVVGTTLSNGVQAFLGIPYASPRRFEAPEPPVAWTGPRPADRFGPSCQQDRTWAGLEPLVADRSEDCLSLNVWAPGGRGAKRPVLVWIHGGGFVAGSGAEDRTDGRRLAATGAVVVTFNYRLGAFGWLVHPALPGGNWGLLDQIAALRWIRRNVSAFGGDSARITIFGEAAGAASAAALLASPLAAGLFDRAILQSPPALDGIAVPADRAALDGVRLATQLGPVVAGAPVRERLTAVPADSLLAALRGAAGRQMCGESPPPLRFGPVVDGRVLPHSIDSSLAGRTLPRIAVMIGSDGQVADSWDPLESTCRHASLSIL